MILSVFIGVHLRLKILKSSVLGVSPNTVYLAPKGNPFVGVLRVKPISNVRPYPEQTMALFRANGPPRYQPWATPKESRPTDRLRTESPPQKSVRLPENARIDRAFSPQNDCRRKTMGDAHGWYGVGLWPARSNLRLDLAPFVVLGAK